MDGENFGGADAAKSLTAPLSLTLAYNKEDKMTLHEVEREYNTRSDQYKELKEEVIFILKKALKEQKIPYDAIYGRVKELDSLKTKISENDYQEPFKEIYDICGIRVVCLFPSHIDQINEIIINNFKVEEKDDKIHSKPAESFGYLSVHYKAFLPDSCSGPRYDHLKLLKFEIQLRTIAAHAWCAISHHLDYKHPNAIPVPLQKQFHALSALFYLADENFESLYKSSLEVKEKAQKIELTQIGKEEINFDILDAYLKKKLPNREIAHPQHMSLLSEELYRAGYGEISQIDNNLNGTEEAVNKIEDEIFGKGIRGFHNVGVVRNALSVVDDNYDKNRISSLKNPEISRKDFKKYVTNKTEGQQKH